MWARRRLLDITFIAAFLVGITWPMMTAFRSSHRDDTWFLEVEKREPAPFPPRGVGPKKFAADFESYFNDHLGLRQQLIWLRNRLELKVFNKSPTSLVLPGQGDWLYLDDQASIDAFLGVVPFTADQLIRLRAEIERRRAWLAARGIAYIFLIAPNKQTIYPEYLPADLRPGGRQTRAHQFLAAVKDLPIAADVVFPDDSLVAAKAEGELYYRRDTHWNGFGAYVGYRAALERTEQVLGWPVSMLALRRDQIVDANIPNGPHGGDLAIMMNITHGAEAATQVSFTTPTCAVATTPPANEDNPPKGFAWTCAADGHGQRALLLHDSFGWSMIPFYAASFASFRSIESQPSFADIVRYVEAEHPTLVIEERVERHFWGAGLLE